MLHTLQTLLLFVAALLQCIAMCCTVLQCVAVYFSMFHPLQMPLLCVAVLLQCVAVYCSMLYPLQTWLLSVAALLQCVVCVAVC